MKVWLHLASSVVGLATAALIVFLVFGSASQDGATQEGSAPGRNGNAGAALCGTVGVAKVTTPAARATAAENLPAMFDPTGPVPAISNAGQRAWFARVHAASGFCADEIGFTETGVARISMSTVPSVSEAQAGQLAALALAQAFGPPFNPRQVTMVVTVDGSDRTAVVSQRSWRAFEAARRQLGVPLTMRSLAQFRQARYRQPDLRIVGWAA